MLAMRIGGGSDLFFSSRSDVDATKIAMLGASSPLTSSSSPTQQQAQSMPPSLKPLEPMTATATMLDRELLQHYAYLRYGDAGSKDKAANGGRKQHVCPVKTCGRRFSTPGNLSRHKRLHGPIKPLKCPVDGCICAFRSENKLEKHMKFHLGIPVHVCPVPACGKTFSTAGNLNRHIKGHHPHVDPFDLKHGTYSTSSSCDEYESSVGGDELMRERYEEEEQEQHEEQVKQELLSGALLSTASLSASAVGTHTYQPTALPMAPPPAQPPADQLDALVAILDQDIGDEDVNMDMSSSSSAMDVELESESMLSLLLEQPKRKYSLLDDMIRFHINHCSTAEEGEEGEQHTDSSTCVL